jgi:23S rRNA maturation-related 3'-5' exoribonuclease YhaM
LSRVSFISGLVVAALIALIVAPAEASEPLRAGIIGCDTSHVIEFTKIFNDPQAEGDLASSGSVQLASSRKRLAFWHTSRSQ